MPAEFPVPLHCGFPNALRFPLRVPPGPSRSEGFPAAPLNSPPQHSAKLQINLRCSIPAGTSGNWRLYARFRQNVRQTRTPCPPAAPPHSHKNQWGSTGCRPGQYPLPVQTRLRNSRRDSRLPLPGFPFPRPPREKAPLNAPLWKADTAFPESRSHAFRLKSPDPLSIRSKNLWRQADGPSPGAARWNPTQGKPEIPRWNPIPGSFAPPRLL